MIQQPELGKKISDLRKAKGFTQEELVDKCNLSVRTLQRIEAGEVTPRPVTVKLIFEALDVSFDKTMKDKGLVLKWLKQFYINFIDLFNLKTNTMKKITILTVIFLQRYFVYFLQVTKVMRKLPIYMINRSLKKYYQQNLYAIVCCIWTLWVIGLLTMMECWQVT